MTQPKSLVIIRAINGFIVQFDQNTIICDGKKILLDTISDIYNDNVGVQSNG